MIDRYKPYRKALFFFISLSLVLTSGLYLWPAWVNHSYSRFIYPSSDVPSQPVAIVFGARVYPDGRLSAMLQDRVETAVQLYHAGKVEKLLLSGDNRFVDYDEPGRMRDYALSRGVPADDIQLDYAGRRTYDTCYRARAIFQLRSAILVSQTFHLPRAIFTCRNLGVEAIGVSADLRPYHPRSISWSQTRELLATSLALVDILFQPPPPILGDPIPISS